MKPATASRVTAQVPDLHDLKKRLLDWAAGFETALYLDSNEYEGYPYSKYECLIGAGVQEEITDLGRLQELIDQQQWVFGYLGYDVKNQLEDLRSNNPDTLGFADLHFFVPRHVVAIEGNEVTFEDNSPQETADMLLQRETPPQSDQNLIEFTPRMDRDEYLEKVGIIQDHIRKGDVYELNLCQEFHAEASIAPAQVYSRLNDISKAPFSAFYRNESKYLMSASPERFLGKRGNQLISQPIKGTIKRGSNPAEDKELASTLLNDEKERAENVMIVDLVRNDLNRSCSPGTVHVEELYGIYAFEQVHQMISTITGQLESGTSVTDAIKNAFPMGSMTGAPKVSAMQLIEDLETTKRSIFSGAVGYFAPNGNFDLNVVIRSLMYDGEKKYLSYQVGSAITIDSVPEKEYDECLLKAEALTKVVSNG